MERQQIFTTGAQRIRQLKAQGKFDEAAEKIRMGLKGIPEDLTLKTSLADLYQHQGRLSEGRILVEEVLARDPANPEALSVLGDLHLKGRAPEKALECYRQALRRDRKSYLILKTARALKELGRLDEALEELEIVLVVNSSTGIDSPPEDDSLRDLPDPLFRSWLYREPPFRQGR